MRWYKMQWHDKRLEERYRQLIRVAGIVILFLLLLGVLSIYFSENSPLQKQNILRKFFPVITGISLDWVQNLVLLIYVVPLLSRWKEKRWVSFYLPSYCLMAVILLLIRYYLMPARMDIADGHPWQFRFLVWGFLMNSVILMTIELVLSRHESARIRLENAELKMLNLQARHEKLKLQLQPHFLFNSLNALKTLIKKDPEKAEGYLIKLSEFLRFSITHTEQNFVSLEEELRVSLYYLEMQQTRFQGCLSYHIDIPGEIPTLAKVPAFSLQLLLENAIKHNALTREAPLHINIRYISPRRILVENNRRPKALAEAGTGVGLKNLSERYRMLAQEDIQILQRVDTFEVYLTLLFHERIERS